MKPRRRPDYRLERLDNEILLYHPAKTKALHLNETASIIWTLCDGHRTTEQVTALIKEGFPEGGDGISDEVESSLRLFAEHGAIDFV